MRLAAAIVVFVSLLVAVLAVAHRESARSHFVLIFASAGGTSPSQSDVGEGAAAVLASYLEAPAEMLTWESEYTTYKRSVASKVSSSTWRPDFHQAKLSFKFQPTGKTYFVKPVRKGPGAFEAEIYPGK